MSKREKYVVLIFLCRRQRKHRCHCNRWRTAIAAVAIRQSYHVGVPLYCLNPRHCSWDEMQPYIKGVRDCSSGEDLQPKTKLVRKTRAGSQHTTYSAAKMRSPSSSRDSSSTTITNLPSDRAFTAASIVDQGVSIFIDAVILKKK